MKPNLIKLAFAKRESAPRIRIALRYSFPTNPTALDQHSLVEERIETVWFHLHVYSVLTD